MHAALFNAERLVAGPRSAVLAPATTGDHYQATPDDSWHALDELAIGSPVHAVEHFKRFSSQVGGIAAIRSLATGRRYELQITAIHLVRASDLTADELAELGHASRASFDLEFGQDLAHRRCWFIRLIPLSAAAAH